MRVLGQYLQRYLLDWHTSLQKLRTMLLPDRNRYNTNNYTLYDYYFPDSQPGFLRFLQCLPLDFLY